MLCHTLIIVCFLKLASCEVGEYFADIHAGIIFIKGDSLAQSAVIKRLAGSSVLECGVQCYKSRICSGVAFRGEECSFLNGTAAVPDFVKSDGSGEDHMVVMFCTEAGDQVGGMYVTLGFMLIMLNHICN